MHSHTFHSQRSIWYPSYLFTSRTSEPGDPVKSANGIEAVFSSFRLGLHNDTDRSPGHMIVHVTPSSTKFVRGMIIKQHQQREDV